MCILDHTTAEELVQGRVEEARTRAEHRLGVAGFPITFLKISKMFLEGFSKYIVTIRRGFLYGFGEFLT